MYLLTITASLVAAYFILYAFFPFFFGQKLERPGARSIISVLIIVILSFAGYAVVLHTRDLEMGNRILHGFGGGFVAFLVCFLAVRDSRISITKFQFAVLGSLIVTGLGVANEIVEYFLQNYGGMVFLRTTNDTWLDLMSNTVGIIIALAVLVPFVGRKGGESSSS
ncbi:MAG: hypothetical protein JWO00_701 [Candidatus Parcubacteria bacterium]|nr:hypothetical protein [Candidatus Parcubacteria bacterium]